MAATAFPSVAHPPERAATGTNSLAMPGMTLQDWFAGQVIAALLGSDSSYSSQRDQNGQLCSMEPNRLANMAKTAYQAAESMMHVRAAIYK